MSASPQMEVVQTILKRDGTTLQAFDPAKLRNAVSKAWLESTGTYDEKNLNQVLLTVTSSLTESMADVETVQDAVETSLMKHGYFAVAKAYILYRQSRKAARRRRNAEIDPKGLSDYIHASKYARWLPELSRREVYEETVARVEGMHLRKFPELEEEISKAFDFVRAKRVLPSMRSLDNDTLLPTPTGWAKVGDVRVGDTLFDQDGRETKVLAIQPFVDIELFDVHFSDGSVLRASGDHLWVTSTLDDRIDGGRTRVVSTNQILGTLRQRSGSERYPWKYNHAVWNAKPVQTSGKELPLDAYILGLWLGDGYSGGQFACHKSDAEIPAAYAAAGFPVTDPSTGNPYAWGTHGLATVLRQMGLRDNKHVPAEYLRAAFEQRLSLVQGLMDSDGHTTTEGRSSFSNSSQSLVDSFCELLASLGIKFSASVIDRKEPHHKDKHLISFFTSLPVHRLTRKRENLRNDHRASNSYRTITSIEPSGHGDATCFLVDAESHTYLAGPQMIVTHNSMQFGGAAIEANNNRIYNCMGVETAFITTQGVKKFSDFHDGDRTTVLTHTGAWKPAVVRSYGRQQLFEITIGRGRSSYMVRATRDHQWLLENGDRTRDLSVKHKLAKAPRLVGAWDYHDANPEARYYWALGYVYGDGTLVKGREGEYQYSMVRLCGADKERFLERFKELGFATSAPASCGGDAMAYTGKYLKTLPSIEADGFENVMAFVRGYLDADGTKNANGDWPSPFSSIQASGGEAIDFICSVFPAVGAYITREEDLTGQETNFGVRPETSRFGLVLGFGDSPASPYSVQEIKEAGYEMVWCLEVEDDHSFVLPNGIVTGNCAFSLVDRLEVFSEAMYLLLSGCGVGYSVQFDHVDKLPAIALINPKLVRHHVVEDTIEGWADALKALVGSYQDGVLLEFSYFQIRSAGTPLKTSGGRAPGHLKLKEALEYVRGVLDKSQGRKLRPVDCHRIMCHAADAVLSGGIRRCMPAGTLVHLARGLTPIEHVKVGDMARTATGFRTVTDVIDQGVQSLVEIRSQMGAFRCTPNHRMAVLESTSTYAWKRADELQEGDRLVFVDHVLEGGHTELPSWTYARNPNDHTSVDITVPEMTADVGWFLGYLHGNGYVHVNRTSDAGGSHVVSFSMNADDAETPGRVAKLRRVFASFGVSASDTKLPGEQTWRVSAAGKQLAMYMETFKRPSTPLRVPECILQAVPEIRAAYLAGLFDSDGGANNRPVLLVSSVYPDFLAQVQAVYASLGIVTRLKMNRPAQENWQALYHLSLVGELPRKHFDTRVAPHAFKHAVPCAVAKKDYGYPRAWVLREKIDFRGAWAPANAQMTAGTFERCAGDRLGLMPITVVDVVEVEASAQTYDISVEGDHEFVANGLLVHNSAMICLFSLDDSEMMYLKTGNWFSSEPWLSNANNSVVLRRDEIKKKQFVRIFEMTRQWGEPGFYFTNDIDYGTNPSMPAGTLVGTREGIFPIELLEGREFEVTSLDGHLAKATCFLSGEDEEVLEIGFGAHRVTHSTKQHRWPVLVGDSIVKKYASELQPGDLIPLNRNEAPGIQGDLSLTCDEGFLTGCFFGDGGIHRREAGTFTMGGWFGEEKLEVAKKLLTIVNRMKKEPSSLKSRQRETGGVEYSIQTSDQEFIQTCMSRYGLIPDKKAGIPSKVWTSNDDFIVGFIDGLMSTDGCFSTDDKRVTFTTSEEAVATDFAKLISFFGVPCAIKKSSTRPTFPNGKTYDRSYERWDVRIGIPSIPSFARVFSVSHPSKQAALEELVRMSSQSSHAAANGIKAAYAKVEWVKPIESQRVWDVTVQHDQHVFPSQYAYTGNCSEIGLYPKLQVTEDVAKKMPGSVVGEVYTGWAFCNLCEINAAKFTCVQDFEEAARAAALIGTLQATYTKMPYLGRVSELLAERESLLGIGMTGMLDAPDIACRPEYQRRVAEKIKGWNAEFAARVGIQPAARTTCVKPSGCQVAGTLVTTDQGILSLGELGDVEGRQWQDQKLHVLTDRGFEASPRYFVNGLAKTKRFVLDSGLTLESTLNHQYRVLSDGAYVWRAAEEIQAGDQICYRVGGYSGGSPQPLARVLYEHPNAQPMKQPAELDADFAWFLGLYAGDGSNHHKGIRINGGETKRAALERAGQILAQQFGLDSVTYARSTGRVLYVNSQGLLRFFAANDLLKGKAESVEIPEIIRRSPRQMIEAFLDGYTCADGCTKSARGVSWSTVSPRMAEQLVVVLRALGRDAKMRLMPPTDSSWGTRMRYWVQERKGRLGERKKSYARRDSWDDLDALGLDNLSVDSVLEIADSENLTYDIEVPETNTYLANSFVSHNTTSLELGCVGSGHHAHHARRYIRRVTADELERVFQAFREVNPHMCVRKPDGKWVIEFPVEAPSGATVRADLGAVQFLEMVRSTQENWVLPGTASNEHAPGLAHNVSNTITVKPDEWHAVAEYVWAHKESFTGVSMLAASGDKDFAFAPNEEVKTEADEHRWNAIVDEYQPIDYMTLLEEDDTTAHNQEAACAGGVCLIV